LIEILCFLAVFTVLLKVFFAVYRTWTGFILSLEPYFVVAFLIPSCIHIVTLFKEWANLFNGSHLQETSLYCQILFVKECKFHIKWPISNREDFLATNITNSCCHIDKRNKQ